MSRSKHFITFVTMVLFAALIYSCSTDSAINDFYGIRMSPIDSAEFKIISYSEEKGVDFENTPLMEPKIFAWAEFGFSTVTIIIRNNSSKAVASTYGTDSFSVLTYDNKEYGLIKGKPYKYPTSGELKAGQKIQLTLELPREFNEVVSEHNQKLGGGDAGIAVVQSYEKGVDTIDLNKKKVKMLKIELGGITTIILKPVLSE